MLDPGDEIVCGWPSFPSYVIDARKRARAATCRCATTATTSTRSSLRGRAAHEVVYVCHPNNPTGTMNTRAELDAYFARVPRARADRVDQAYFEYVERPDYPDAVAEYFGAAVGSLVLRTFSKIYGLAGLRVGYGVGAARRRRRDRQGAPAVRRDDAGQVAALASLGDAAEIARRRA